MVNRNDTRVLLKRRLGAYSLAAGLAVAAGGASESLAYLAYFDNGGGGWFDDRPHFAPPQVAYDMILIQLDGTVLVDDAQIDPALPAGSSIELMGEHFAGNYTWGDGKTRDTAFVRCTNAGVVGTYWSGSPEAVKLGYGGVVGPSSQFVTGDVGLYGYGWYSVVGSFGGRGYLGFYIDNPQGGHHYGWADIHISSGRNEITLYRFAIETVAGRPASLILTPPGPLGDCNADYLVNAADVDSMYEFIASGLPGGGTYYDVDADGDVDEDDVTYLIEVLLEVDSDGDGFIESQGTFRGDFNLDGSVDGTDLSIMAGTFGQSVGYAAGNANGDPTVDGTDLSILSSTFGSVATTSVPEPMTLSLLALGATGLVAHRRRK